MSGPFKLYIGAKLLRAMPQDRDGKPGYTVLYSDGYRSWSPKDTFEVAYREVSDSEKELAVVHENWRKRCSGSRSAQGKSR